MICSKFGIEIPSDRSRWISEEEVKVISPKTLLKKFEIGKIDLLQIDAEGYDLEVIRIFDIENSKPEAIIFENVGLEENDYQTYLEKLKDAGYKTRKFGPNTLALKNGYTEFQKYFT